MCWSLLPILIIIVLFFWFYQALNTPLPKTKNKNFSGNLNKINDVTCFNSAFCKANKYGIYEVYAEGNAFERGYAMGQVLKPLKAQHEKNFVDSIYELVPSKSYVQFLRVIVGIMNRNLHKFFKDDYKEELLGLSYSSSAEYNYIAPPYQRVLNYHAAHDIGHALQNMGLVACSSFVLNNNKTNDGNLLLARNLDFSPSEKFNELKVLYFINPEKGNKYISYSWPGFIGVVSGMNEHGLCVVLHSAKSKMRLKIGTPVSIIAREIMQEAKNLAEAEVILKKRQSFVSELFLVVSALDNSACVFEKEPSKLTKYYMQEDKLICTNHYLSEEKKDTIENIEWKNTISSAYREERLKELITNKEEITPTEAVEILRNIKGLGNEDIGIQNECAINQLAAHHGIVFKPQTLAFWVSTNPYCMGSMVAYNFKDAFKTAQINPEQNLYNEDVVIAKDAFLDTQQYKNFLAYKTLEKEIKTAIKRKVYIEEEKLEQLISLNPKLFFAYEIVGNYYLQQNNKQKAKQCFKKALNLKIATKFEKKRIEKNLSKC